MHITDRCYQLTKDGWILFAKMREERFFAASVVYNNSLWVTGGTNDYNHLSGVAHNSSEYSLPNGHFAIGPTLPLQLRRQWAYSVTQCDPQ